MEEKYHGTWNIFSHVDQACKQILVDFSSTLQIRKNIL